MILKRKFYEQPTLIVARKLLGCTLISYMPSEITGGNIVETEAYLGVTDPGSHAFIGTTNRNKPMFGKAGFAYTYHIHGRYVCLNIVTEKQTVAGAVLIRSLAPTIGITEMRKRRHNKKVTDLCNGPAKLTQALGITKELNEYDLTSGFLYVQAGTRTIIETEIVQTTRIGIKKGVDLPFRFYLKDNPFVSQLSQKSNFYINLSTE